LNLLEIMRIACQGNDWIQFCRLPLAEREARVYEVDRSLTTWGQDLHRYLRA
jgi:hypothetical protein